MIGTVAPDVHVDTPPVRRHARRTLLTLVGSAAVGACGLAAGGTAGALLGSSLAGTDAAGGLPLGCVVIGSALGALVIIRCADAFGYPAGLAVGYGVGALGAIVVVAAAQIESLAGVLLGSVLLGAANAAVSLTRYAAVEVVDESHQGQAVGWTFFATAIGAVLSPRLLGPSGDLALALGVPRLSGMYVVAVAAFVAAAAVLALAFAHRKYPSDSPGSTSGLLAGLGCRDARAAIGVLAVTNLLMVGVMAVAPMRLLAHGHDIDVIGIAISAHVAGMFGPSVLSGWLADTFQPRNIAAAGVALLLVAGLWGVLAPAAELGSTTALLVILGVGWNLGVVGGSAVLVAAVPTALRPRAEGIGEVAMGLAAAVGAPLAGLLMALAGSR